MKTVKKHLFLLLGVGLFTAGFFNFSHSTYSGGYFYDSEYVFLLTIGSVLITLWFVKKEDK